MGLQEILRFLERKDIIKTPTSYFREPIKLPFDLTPQDFIKFAEDDLKEDNERAFINAISNIKRSIDCRLESLLYLFGFYNKAKKEDWSFPYKISLLLKIGVVAPRILNKINKKRNELEHEFKKPSREEVEDFLDISNLFLLYTRGLLNKTFDQEFEWLCEDDEKTFLKIKLDSKMGMIEMELINCEMDNNKVNLSVEDGENYLRILKYWVLCVLDN